MPVKGQGKHYNWRSDRNGLTGMKIREKKINMRTKRNHEGSYGSSLTNGRKG